MQQLPFRPRRFNALRARGIDLENLVYYRSDGAFSPTKSHYIVAASTPASLHKKGVLKQSVAELGPDGAANLFAGTTPAQSVANLTLLHQGPAVALIHYYTYVLGPSQEATLTSCYWRSLREPRSPSSSPASRGARSSAIGCR